MKQAGGREDYRPCPKSQGLGARGWGGEPAAASRVPTAPGVLTGFLSARQRTDRRRSEGRGGGGERGGGAEACALPRGSSARGPGVAWGWDGRREAGSRQMCVHTAGSRRSAGTNTALPGNYTPILKKKIAAEILSKKKRSLIYYHCSCSRASDGRPGDGGTGGGKWEEEVTPVSAPRRRS